MADDNQSMLTDTQMIETMEGTEKTGRFGRKSKPDDEGLAFMKIKPKLEDIPDNPDRTCLSCGTVIGNRLECSKCSAKQWGRISEKKIIAISFVLLLMGTIFLSAASVYSETDISHVEDLRETDNFRHTRIVGKVIDLVDYYPEKYDPTGTIRMLLDDGTGTIWVKTAPFVTEVLLEEQRIPGFGDTVDCEGSLFVGDDNYMQIKVRDKNLFRIQEREYQQVTIGDLVPSNKEDFEVGAQIEVTGKILDRFYIEGFAWILDIGDTEGHSLSIFIPDSVGLMTGDLEIDAIFLAEVTVKGALEWYEGDQQWEIIPASTQDIIVLTPYTGDDYAVLTVSEFLANPSQYHNGFVQIDNVTTAWVYADYLFSISDSTSFEEVSIFVDWGANASLGIVVGEDFHVRGWVTYYDGNNNGVPDADEWELKIRAASSDYALRDSEFGGA